MNTQTTDKYAAARKAWYDAWERAEAVRARRVIADRQDWRTLRNLVECEMVPAGAGGEPSDGHGERDAKLNGGG